MKLSTVASLLAVASLTPTIANGAVLNLRPPEETIAAARSREKRDGNAGGGLGRVNSSQRRAAKRANRARRARRGW